SQTLYSRCVTIKISEVEGKQRGPDLEMFLSAVRKQLAAVGVVGDVHIDSTRDQHGLERSRRVLHIKDRSVIGYAVSVSGLSDDESVKLQVIGLGGRRRMGCGVFVPIKHRTSSEEEVD
ncbi:MAG: type I-MYXAN CRISPR-associated protein Cas6/Cmx6, partial [Pyrinomonadaceae bacterium]